MTRSELREMLNVSGVSPRRYSIDGGPREDRHVLLEDGPVWLVFYEELGQRNDERLFLTEGEACQCLYDRLVKTRRT